MRRPRDDTGNQSAGESLDKRRAKRLPRLLEPLVFRWFVGRACKYDIQHA
jgi:hypothetical protein